MPTRVTAALDGDHEAIASCRKHKAFVATIPEIDGNPKAVNGASDLIAEALGDNGRRMRSAIGMSSLPIDEPVEIEAAFVVAKKNQCG